MCYEQLNPRFHMWNRLIGPRSTKKQRVELALLLIGKPLPGEIHPIETDILMSQMFTSVPVYSTETGHINYVQTLSLDCCATTVPCVQETEVKKEKNMSRYNDDYDDCCSAPTTDAQRTKDYLNCRSSDIWNQQRSNLLKTFNMNDEPAPLTFTDFVQRVKDGKLALTEGTKEDKYFWSVSSLVDHIHWRDPAKPKDAAGFETAMKSLDKAQTKVQDAVAVLPAEEALSALQAFETATFH